MLDIHEKSTVESNPRGCLVCDAHVDTLSEILDGRDFGKRSESGHVDLVRLKEGGINVQIFACWIAPKFAPDNAIKRTLILIDLMNQQLEQYSDKIALAKNVDEIKQIYESGRLAAILSIEGGHAIQGEVAALRIFYQLGVRGMTLTWNNHNELADSSKNPKDNGGLTELGKTVVREMNRLGMLVDISHSSEKTFWDTIERSEAPIIASHSNAKRLCNHRRNLTDEMIKAISEHEGFIGINFYPNFLRSSGEASLEDVLDHIDYIVKLAGVDCVGLGSDFDGISKVPVGLEDCSKMPNITKGLIERGYSENEISKILGGNFLRVFKKVVGYNTS